MQIKRAPAEYYDDFYYFRGRIFRPLDKIFSKFDPAEMPVRQLKRLGFDTRRIHVDVEDRPKKTPSAVAFFRSEEHTSELQSHHDLVCRLLLEKKKTKKT